MPTKYDFKDITPNVLRSMTDKELQEVCTFLLQKSVDVVILQDMIMDRNDFRDCYYKLTKQLQDIGVEPCIDYFKKSHKKGRKKNV